MNKKPAILGGTPEFPTLLPLVSPTLPAYDELENQTTEIISTGMLTKGKYLREFEERVAEYLNVKYVVAVSSCTLGLMLSYQALGLKGEVIVPSFTFMATVHPLVWNHVTPVFVDIDAKTWNIDPTCVEQAITSRTSGIVAVHNFGNPAPVQQLEAVAQQHHLPLVFDAAHGFGALYRGKPVGAFGDVEVFSLSPTKVLVAGEGGIVATNHEKIAQHVRIGREYGNPGDYGSNFAGVNARMPEFNALLGIKSLQMLENNATRRNQVAARFRERLGRLPGITFQKIDPEDRSSYKDLSLTVDENEFGLTRDELSRAVTAEKIDVRKYHDPPVHTHKAYRDVSLTQPLDTTNWVASRSLSLPIYSHMDFEVVDRICSAIENIAQFREEIKELN